MVGPQIPSIFLFGTSWYTRGASYRIRRLLVSAIWLVGAVICIGAVSAVLAIAADRTGQFGLTVVSLALAIFFTWLAIVTLPWTATRLPGYDPNDPPGLRSLFQRGFSRGTASAVYMAIFILLGPLFALFVLSVFSGPAREREVLERYGTAAHPRSPVEAREDS